MSAEEESKLLSGFVFLPPPLLETFKRIQIKPLSVNAAWQGKRFKTKEYKDYEALLLMVLPKFDLPQKPYEIYYKFGFSNRNSDLVNPEKLITDILCKKYNFDDRYIERMVLEKEIVKKGAEYIQFAITHFEL